MWVDIYGIRLITRMVGKDLKEDGLLLSDIHGIEITPRGVPLMRVVAMRFDATWVEGANKHSKTV